MLTRRKESDTYLMKATVLAESYDFFYLHCDLSTPAMSFDSSQVGVAVLLTCFLSFYLSRFSFYINEITG